MDALLSEIEISGSTKTYGDALPIPEIIKRLRCLRLLNLQDGLRVRILENETSLTALFAAGVRNGKSYWKAVGFRNCLDL